MVSAIALLAVAQLAPASRDVPPLGRYTVYQIVPAVDFPQFVYAGVVELGAKGNYVFRYDKSKLKGSGVYGVANRKVTFRSGPYSGLTADYKVRDSGVPALNGKLRVKSGKVDLVMTHDAYEKAARQKVRR